jgi:hypothetical protein
LRRIRRSARRGSKSNRRYSQMQGREELFERERHREPVAGWHSCELACAEVEQNAY